MYNLEIYFWKVWKISFQQWYTCQYFVNLKYDDLQNIIIKYWEFNVKA